MALFNCNVPFEEPVTVNAPLPVTAPGTVIVLPEVGANVPPAGKSVMPRLTLSEVLLVLFSVPPESVRLFAVNEAGAVPRAESAPIVNVPP